MVMTATRPRYSIEMTLGDEVVDIVCVFISILENNLYDNSN
jgi:hypothetical protein